MTLATPIRYLDTNLADAATVTTTDAATDFPAIYLQATNRQLPWRSANVTGTKRITIAHGSSKQVKALALLDTNLTTGATGVLYSSSNGSDWTKVADLVLTRTINGTTAVLNPIVLWCDSTAAYHAVDLADASNPDGYIQVGRLFAGTYQEAAKNYVHPQDTGHEDLSQREDAINGTPHFNIKPQRRRLRVRFETPLVAQREQMEALIAAHGTHTQLFVHLAPDTTAHDRWCVYGRFGDPLPSFNHRSWSIFPHELVIEEDV